MTTPADGNGGGDVPSVVVASVALIAIAAIGAVTFLVWQEKDVTGLLTIMGVLSPFIIALLAVRNSHRTDVQIAQVRRQVDGKIDNLVQDKTNLEHQVSVAGLTPVTATVSFDPDSTGPFHPISDSDLPETNPPTNPHHLSVGEVLHRLEKERDQHG